MKLTLPYLMILRDNNTLCLVNQDELVDEAPLVVVLVDEPLM
jgi:hypothetical protein